MRDLLLRLSIPVQKVMQKMHPPEPQTTVAMAEKAMETMEDGDVLLSREDLHFTNMFIPGFWSHAAIYGQGKVVEAVAPKVQVVDFRDWVTRKNYWLVARPIQDDPKAGARVFAYGVTQAGIDYDYGFSDDNGLWYCSELVRGSWETAGNWGKDALTKKDIFGADDCTPEDIYQAALRGQLKVIHEWRDK